jgi:hypothetical protein
MDRTVVRNRYAGSARVPGEHQRCFAQVLRNSRELAADGDPAAKRFDAGLRAVFHEA